MALSSNSIIPITKHRDDPRNVAVPPLWVDRRRVEPRASKSATDATAGIWRPHRHDVRSCRTAIPGAGIAPCLIGMDACVGAPHLSRKLKPTVTIRDWSPQNMTRVRFARKVQDYALARCGGKGPLWVRFARRDLAPPTAGLPSIAERRGNLAEFGSLCLDSFRAGQMAATEGVGHKRSLGDLNHETDIVLDGA